MVRHLSFNPLLTFPHSDKEYIMKGEWKCPESESGAHCWLLDQRGKGVCKYCGMNKPFEVVFENYLYKGTGDRVRRAWKRRKDEANQKESL